MLNGKRLKYLLTVIIGIIAFMTTNAATLSPQEAVARISATNLHSSNNDLTLRQIYRDSASRPTCYLFTQPSGGFLLIAADDCVNPILGYSLDSQNILLHSESDCDIPPAFSWWAEQYTAQINKFNGEHFRMATNPFRNTYSPIEPLVRTQWAQGSPYNSLCPMKDSRQCVVGCVATALAQVMAYHKWPNRGVGSHSYDWNGTELELDFSTIEFDWQNMPRNAADMNSQEKINAAALLSYACGVAVNMDYSPSASGALTGDMYLGLLNNFNYDRSMAYADRDLYRLRDWENLIYYELQQGRPVIYTGSSAEGAHAFICDGYSSDGYFHFNWGWGGTSDGYFLLTALEPEVQGIGGSGFAFDYNQTILYGIQPALNESNYTETVYQNTFEILTQECLPGENITISSGPANISIIELNMFPGLRISPVGQGNAIYTAGSAELLPPFYKMEEWLCPLPDGLDDGAYIVTPVYRTSDDEDWKDVKIYLSGKKKANMVLSDGKAEFIEEAAPWPILSDIQRTSLYADKRFKITGTITNSSASAESYSVIYAALLQEGELKAIGAGMMHNMQGGESEEFTYISRFYDEQRQTPSPGDYEFAMIIESDLDIISPLTPPETINLQYCPPTILSAEISLDGTQGNTWYDALPVTLTIEAQCYEGFFDADLLLVISQLSETKGETPIYEHNIKDAFIDICSPYSTLVEIPLTADVGQKFKARLYANMDNGFEPVADDFIFEIASISVTELDAHKDCSTYYISPSGIKYEHQPSGLSFRVQRHSDGSNVITKVITIK